MKKLLLKHVRKSDRKPHLHHNLNKKKSGVNFLPDCKVLLQQVREHQQILHGFAQETIFDFLFSLF
jgi:hypothetical protein